MYKCAATGFKLSSSGNDSAIYPVIFKDMLIISNQIKSLFLMYCSRSAYVWPLIQHHGPHVQMCRLSRSRLACLQFDFVCLETVHMWSRGQCWFLRASWWALHLLGQELVSLAISKSTERACFFRPASYWSFIASDHERPSNEQQGMVGGGGGVGGRKSKRRGAKKFVCVCVCFIILLLKLICTTHFAPLPLFQRSNFHADPYLTLTNLTFLSHINSFFFASSLVF